MHALPLTVALLALAAPSASADDVSPPPDLPPLAAALGSCATSALPAERIAVFTGSMPALDMSDRMSMRFDLERLRPGERLWRRVAGAPTFGVWERSLPNRAGFVFRKHIDGLQVPASYRVLVRFRWETSSGEIVRRRHRRTAVCQQPDLRPDLVPETVTAIIDVAGTGSTEVAQLAAGTGTSVLVLAPACPSGSRLLVRVDADGRVDEADERGNLLRGVCPDLMS
jgi:hypothetical protein